MLRFLGPPLLCMATLTASDVDVRRKEQVENWTVYCRRQGCAFAQSSTAREQLSGAVTIGLSREYGSVNLLTRTPALPGPDQRVSLFLNGRYFKFAGTQVCNGKHCLAALSLTDHDVEEMKGGGTLTVLTRNGPWDGGSLDFKLDGFERAWGRAGETL